MKGIRGGREFEPLEGEPLDPDLTYYSPQGGVLWILTIPVAKPGSKWPNRYVGELHHGPQPQSKDTAL